MTVMRFIGKRSSRTIFFLAAAIVVIAPVHPHTPPVATGAVWIDAAQKTDLFGDPLPVRATARLGTVRHGEELPAGSEPSPSLRGVLFSPDGTLVASRGEPADPAATPRTVRLWEAATGKLVRVLEGQTRPILAMAFSPDGKILVGSRFQDSDLSGLTIAWNVATGESLWTIDEGGPAVRFSADGASVAVAVRDKVHVYGAGNGREVQRFLGPNVALAISADRRQLLALSQKRDTRLRLFEIASGRELLKLEVGRSEPTLALLAADGRTIAAVSGGNEIHLWEVATGERLHTLSGHQRRVFAVEFSPDNRFLATGDIDGEIRLWELATGQEVNRLKGHRGAVTAVAFSPAGDRLASGSTDRTALVWDLAGATPSQLPRDPLDEKLMEELWHDLAALSPATAYRAMGLMSADEERAVDYLRRRVESLLVPVQDEQIRRLIRELDDNDYLVRYRASEELKKLLEVAKPILLKVVKETRSAEVRYRLRRLLTGAEETPRFSTADIRRMLRILQALEQVGSQESEAVVERILNEFPSEPVAEEARRTLARLRRR